MTLENLRSATLPISSRPTTKKIHYPIDVSKLLHHPEQQIYALTLRMHTHQLAKICTDDLRISERAPLVLLELHVDQCGIVVVFGSESGLVEWIVGAFSVALYKNTGRDGQFLHHCMLVWLQPSNLTEGAFGNTSVIPWWQPF
eukprot:IDg2144t1